MSTAEHVMRISRNGQVSIPAATRQRWKAAQVVVVDLGDRVVMRPLSDTPVEDLQGKYRDTKSTGDDLRRQARREEQGRRR